MIGLLAALALAPLSGRVEPWTPAGVSSPMFESHPAFDPWNGDLYFVRSGSTMIVQAGDSYYQTWPKGAGWTPRVKLGLEINANGSEIGALFSPSGKSLMFARDGKDWKSGEFLVLQAKPEAWPRPCPAR